MVLSDDSRTRSDGKQAKICLWSSADSGSQEYTPLCFIKAVAESPFDKCFSTQSFLLKPAKRFHVPYLNLFFHTTAVRFGKTADLLYTGPDRWGKTGGAYHHMIRPGCRTGRGFGAAYPAFAAYRFHKISYGGKFMVNIESYLSQPIDLLRRQYGARLLYVGLQGSYLRGEATDRSDIDIIVCDRRPVRFRPGSLPGHPFPLSRYRIVPADLFAARPTLPIGTHSKFAICCTVRRTATVRWNRLSPAYTAHDVRNFVKISINGLYHEICHAYVHADHDAANERISGAYKSAFFILQDLYFPGARGIYPNKGTSAAVAVRPGQSRPGARHTPRRREVFRPAESFALLFAWCQDALKRL